MPLGRLLWQDTLLYGTAVNVAAALVAMLLLARDAPPVVAAAIFLAPTPYNTFLVAAVFRRAAVEPEPWAMLARALALAWFCAALLV